MLLPTFLNIACKEDIEIHSQFKSKALWNFIPKNKTTHITKMWSIYTENTVYNPATIPWNNRVETLEIIEVRPRWERRN